jgi:AraC-like DNA-binding protein
VASFYAAGDVSIRAHGDCPTTPLIRLYIRRQVLYFLGQLSFSQLTEIMNTSESLSRGTPPWNGVQDTLRIGATIGVPEVLRKLDQNPSEVLSAIDIDPELFNDPGNQISFWKRGQMLDHCATWCACPHFGLLVGQQAGLGQFGLLGLLSKYSASVGTALGLLSRYMHLHVRGATTLFTVDAGLAVLEYQVYYPDAPGHRQVCDGAVAVAFNILRELCGESWAPSEVQFAHERPENTTPYRQFFNGPLRFDAGRYGIAFDAEWLEHPLPESDPELLKLLQAEVDRVDARLKGDFETQVRAAVRGAIVNRQCSAAEVAERFSMHRRSMSRHLRSMGTSFRALAEDVRFELARHFLEESRMEIIQIASMLGYSNASAFTRAFRRWSGSTPARWRETERKRA